MKEADLNEIPFQGVSHNPEIKKRVLVPYGSLPPIAQVSEADFGPNQVADSHKHDDMYEMFWVTKGRLIFVVNERLIAAGPGKFIVVEPGEDHEIRNGTEPSVVTVISFLVNQDNPS